MQAKLTLSLVALCATLAACSHTAMKPSFDQSALPAAVQVPAGHRVSWETVGVGQITYECRAKAGMPGAHEWVFVGPDAELRGRDGQRLGRYFGPPATWEALDGSRLTGTQLAVAPGSTGAIPLQLVKVNPLAAGTLAGTSHIQRVATRGGVAPAMACDAGTLGQRQVVTYQADYIFWKPA